MTVRHFALDPIEGKSWAEIGRLMDARYNEKRAPYRYRRLIGKDR